MIKFDPELLAYEEMQVRAVTINGFAFALIDGKEQSIRIDRSVYQSFKSKYKVTRFKTYRNMVFIKYNGYIVDIETYPTYIPQEFRERFLLQYRFNSIDNIDKIKTIEEFNPKYGRWYIDGRYVFELVKDSEGNPKVSYVNSDKFGVCSAKCFKLSDLKSAPFYDRKRVTPHTLDMLDKQEEERVKAWERMIKSQNKESESAEDKKEKKKETRGRKPSYTGALAGLIRKYRSVIIFKPNNDIMAISPTLPNINLSDIKSWGTSGIDDSHHVNLYFLKKASSEIGSAYGHKANKILNLRQTLADYKLVNFMDLPTASLKVAPVGITFEVALAWLLRFSYSESDIIKMRKLQDLLSLLTESGLVHKSSIKIVEDQKKESTKTERQFANVKEMRKSYRDFYERLEMNARAVA